MFGDLMSFLLDCVLAQITNETYHIISFCDLHKKIAKGKEWILSTDENVNVDFVQYAKDLGWKNKEVYKSTWSRSKRVPFATIAELLNELSFKEKQEFSPNERRTSLEKKRLNCCPVSGVRCPVSVRTCVRNSYLSTSATNQYGNTQI